MKIGLIINHAENPEPAVIPSYPTMRDLAELGELGGLDSIWLFTPLFRFDGETSGIWECWTLLSGTAEQIARAFHAYQQAGAAQLIIHLTHQTPAAIHHLAEAVRQYR